MMSNSCISDAMVINTGIKLQLLVKERRTIEDCRSFGTSLISIMDLSIGLLILCISELKRTHVIGMNCKISVNFRLAVRCSGV